MCFAHCSPPSGRYLVPLLAIDMEWELSGAVFLFPICAAPSTAVSFLGSCDALSIRRSRRAAASVVLCLWGNDGPRSPSGSVGEPGVEPRPPASQCGALCGRPHRLLPQYRVQLCSAWWDLAPLRACDFLVAALETDSSGQPRGMGASRASFSQTQALTHGGLTPGRRELGLSL